MQTVILRVLRATAAPGRHNKFRRTRDIRVEHKIIRQNLCDLRCATTLPNAHLVCGLDGTIIHLGWRTVSSAAPIECFPLAALALGLGTPFIDLRPITDAGALAKVPKVVRGPSDEGDFQYNPQRISLSTYLDLIEPLGALTRNDPRKRDDQ